MKRNIIIATVVAAVICAASLRLFVARAEIAGAEIARQSRLSTADSHGQSPASTCTGLSYSGRSTFATGSAPAAVAKGDFNGDGKPDVAVANTGSNDVSVLLGDGTGGFAPAVNLPVGLAPISIAAGDFNSDGKLDLVTANNGSNDVSVLLGNGAGGFSPAASFTVGSNPVSIAVGDFNGDGKPDVVVANNSTQNVSVLLGGGAGSFGITNYSVAGNANGVAVGDFNGDGKQDLAVSNGDLDNVSILIGNGAGVFGAPANFAAGSTPGFVVAADLNGDNKLDLAVANTNGGDVSILLGNGAGSFSAATNFNTGMNPNSISVGDLNGDNKLDLAVANSFSDNVSALLGNGDGSFSAANNFGTGASAMSVIAADFNGDGKPDLIVANQGQNDVALLSDGTGGFGAHFNYGVGANPRGIAAGDFNGDGKQDVVTANLASANLSVLLSNGASFGATTNFSAASPFNVAVGDLNGDGKQDLVSANFNSNSVSILLGNGAGSFGAAADFAAGGRAAAVAIADFNGDGKPDLAVALQNMNGVAVLLGDGTGNFSAPTTFAAGSFPRGVAVGDFNGDSKQDIIVANSGSSNVSVLLGNGAGGFGAAVNFTVGTSPLSVAVGDLNGDGKKDLVVANNGSDNVSVLLGNGAGGFSAATNFNVGTNPASVVIGDLDSDGKPDIATANQGSDNVSVLLGNGSGSFAAALNFNVGTSPDALAIGDFNGDGAPDLAVADSNNNVWILLRSCPAPGNSFVVTNTNDSGAGSLRQAMLDANSTSGTQTISFNIPGPGVHTISPASALPQITDPVVIDGATQPGYDASPLIEVSGASAGAGAKGFAVSAGNTTIRALTINRFATDGIDFAANGGNLVEGCYIGTNATGTAAAPNGVHGIAVVGISNNTIGGTRPAARNIISGNGVDGVFFQAGATNNTIAGNFIGTNLAGTAALGNGADGVEINGSSNNMIGGATAASRNVISGNHGNGVEIIGATSSGITVKNNYIGTDVTGNNALANSGVGVLLSGIALPATGTAVELTSDLISGNAGDGLKIVNSGAVVQSSGVQSTDFSRAFSATKNPTEVGTLNAGNGSIHPDQKGAFLAHGSVLPMGLRADGGGTLPNGGNGVTIENSSHVVIGGDSAAERNIISGNLGNGIEVNGGNGNFIENNYIGTNAAGTAAMPNHRHGVLVNLPSNPTDTVATITDDLISGNTGDGIRFDGSAGVPPAYEPQASQTVRALRALSADGTSALPAANPIHPDPGYAIVSRAGHCQIIGNGGDGVSIINTSNVLIGGDTSADRNIISGNLGNGIEISGATSSGITVKNNYIGTDVTGNHALANSGVGVLLSGIALPASGMAVELTSDVISGNAGDGLKIVNSGAVVQSSGVQSTDFSRAFSATKNPTEVGTLNAGNGSIHPNQRIAILAHGSVCPIGLRADGGGALPNGGNGVTIENSTDVVIGGETAAERNIISGNMGNGIEIRGAGSASNEILYNYIGTDATGIAAMPNHRHGVLVNLPSNPTDTVATITDALISGNTGDGIRFAGSASQTVRALRALSADGTSALPAASPIHPDPRYAIVSNSGHCQIIGNGGDGVSIINASNVLIGGDTSADRNIISGNHGNGVSVSGANSFSNQISNNYIGTDASGNHALANSGVGVLLSGIALPASGTAVELTSDVISGNAGDGLKIVNSGAVVQSSGVQSTESSRAFSATKNPTEVGTLNAGNGSIHPNQKGVILAHGSILPIGLRADGGGTLPNGGNGVTIENSSHVVIGGDTAAERNTISGNLGNGIEVTGGNGNFIENNYIGTNAAGTAAMPNHRHGVLVNLPSNPTDTVATITDDLISGNTGDGIRFVGSASGVPPAYEPQASQTVRALRALSADGTSALPAANPIHPDPGFLIVTRSGHCQIGVDQGGVHPLSNGGNGVSIINASNIQIGGPGSTDGNTIAGNQAHGLVISGAGAHDNLVQGNRFYTIPPGSMAKELSIESLSGNQGNGILIEAGASNNTIGGAGTYEGNQIAYSGRAGIAITGNSNGNYIVGNSIFANNGLGIDLGGDGPTANDPCDADPGLQNYPVLTQAKSSSTTTITGNLNSTPNSTFRVDFYSSATAGPGVGQNYLGSTIVTTNGSCNASTNVTIPVAVAPGKFVSATATDAHGNTSEISGGVVVLQGNQAPVAKAKNITVSAGSNCQASVTAAQVNDGSFDPDTGDTITLSLDSTGPFSIGPHQVKLTATDNHGASSSATATVTVKDTAAPVISGVSVNPWTIWPPNKKMVSVTVNYTTSDCQPVTVSLSIASNEPTAAGDMMVINPHLVSLRADRLGDGDGRVYTITIKAVDASGNISTQQATVSVPHDQGH